MNFKENKRINFKLKSILGVTLFETGLQKKKIRSGKGKLKRKKVQKIRRIINCDGNSEKLNSNSFEIRNVEETEYHRFV